MKNSIFYTAAFLILIPAISLAQTVPSAKTEALKQFNKLKPGIEKSSKGIVDNPMAVEGDINGDGRTDCLISYVLTPKAGGNMIIGHDVLIYLNTGKGMKAAGKFPEF